MKLFELVVCSEAAVKRSGHFSNEDLAMSSFLEDLETIVRFNGAALAFDLFESGTRVRQGLAVYSQYSVVIVVR